VPTLTINGQSVHCAEGKTILDAARGASIDIPTLCWYPKLPTAGNCRICLVSVEGSGKLLPSCATAAAEGMVVMGTEVVPRNASSKANVEYYPQTWWCRLLPGKLELLPEPPAETPKWRRAFEHSP